MKNLTLHTTKYPGLNPNHNNIYNIPLSQTSMPIDVQKLNQDKEKIISSIRLRGPSLPSQIARTIGVEPLFASAFLSELKAEQKIKVSHMKVGSSPLYYLSGQENLLENHINYLNQREKEAVSLLRKSKILEDSSLEPVTRVALASIKDFAIPVKVRINEESRIFWKYYLLPDSELQSEIQKLLSPVSEKILEKEVVKELPAIPVEKTIEKKVPEPVKKIEKAREKIITPETKEKPKQKKVKVKPVYLFPSNIQEYLHSKDIEILQVLLEKKKEFCAKIRIDTLFGKQELFLLAKDKKSINENDLNLALQKAQSEKMTALFMSPGDLNKKAEEHLKSWKNLVKFEKLKF